MYFEIIVHTTTDVCVLSVGDPATSSINSARPDPPTHSSAPTRGYGELIKTYLSALRTDGSAAQQTTISARLGKLATTHNVGFEVQRAEKEEKTAKFVTKWLGVNHMNSLLNMTDCNNEEKLNASVTIYTIMTKEKKTGRIGLCQAAINALLDMRSMEGFSVMIIMSVYS